MTKVVRPKYGLDVDGCYADFTYGFTRLARELDLVKAPWRVTDQDVWNFASSSEPPEGPVERFNDAHVWYEVSRRWNWWMTLEPLIDEREVNLTNELIDQADVYFITARGQTAGLSTEQQTAGWLRGININVDRATVIACSTAQKGPIAKALGITAFLDDHLDNLYALDAAGIALPVACMRKYNEAWPGLTATGPGAFIEALL